MEGVVRLLDSPPRVYHVFLGGGGGWRSLQSYGHLHVHVVRITLVAPRTLQ